MSDSAFAARFSQALETAGMSAAELGRRCGISKATISQYRSGLYEPKRERITQIARELGCSVDWLAGEDVPMTAASDAGQMGTIPLLSRISLEGDTIFSPEAIAGYVPAEPRYCDGHHFIIKVVGDSMEPVFVEGDQLLCVRQDTLKEGQLGVFLLPGGEVIVRLLHSKNEKLVLVSFSHYYPPRSLDAFGGARVVARVVRSTRLWE